MGASSPRQYKSLDLGIVPVQSNVVHDLNRGSMSSETSAAIPVSMSSISTDQPSTLFTQHDRRDSDLVDDFAASPTSSIHQPVLIDSTKTAAHVDLSVEQVPLGVRRGSVSSTRSCPGRLLDPLTSNDQTNSGPSALKRAQLLNLLSQLNDVKEPKKPAVTFFDVTVPESQHLADPNTEQVVVDE